MPVTGKFSKLFYDRLGEQVANELVDWFNAVDSAYRTDLRELNEVNFTRFDVRLEQRITALDAKLEQRIMTLDGKLEQRVTALDAKLEKQLGILNARIDQVAAELREAVERGLKEQTRWMFVAWGSLLIPIIGLWLRG